MNGGKGTMSENTWVYETDSGIKLRPFQQDLADTVLEDLNTKGQCGLEVMTSGGKSYIAAHIITEYLNYHTDKEVLWFGPKTACHNVKTKVLDKLPVRNRIKYINYEEIARSQTSAHDLSEIELVIFDECHRAYATKTFQGITNVLSEIGDVDILAMSATPVRMGGKNTFKVLVPKVDEDDYIKFDIATAAQNDMLPDINYVLANMKISSADFRFIEKFKSIADKNEEARALYNDVIDTLHSFNFDLKKDLSKMLMEKLKSADSTGAERHIVFFSTIAQLKDMKSGVKQAFESAYPQCKVNILEFHSKMTDQENSDAFKKFVADEPVEGEIDVMLSVDKATESIHPENIKSIMMFRGTQSIRVYLQQIGRGVMLKQFHPDGITIFDFAENIECLGNFTIMSGNRAVSDRPASVGTEEDTVNAVRAALLSIFGYSKALTTELGIEEINQCVEKLKKIGTIASIERLQRNVVKVEDRYNRLVQSGYATPTDNLYVMIEMLKMDIEADIEERYTQSKIDEQVKALKQIEHTFKSAQQIYFASEIDRNERIVNYFDTLGHMAYLTPKERDTAASSLKAIDKIAAELEKNGEISACSNYAKGKLKELRRMYLNRDTGNGVRVYAIHKNVDISMKDISEKELNSLAETDIEKEILREYKYLIRKIKEAGEVVSFKDWIKISAIHLVLKNKHSGDFAAICNKYVETNYYSHIFQYKIHHTTRSKCMTLIKCINKVNNGELLTGEEETYVYKSSYDALEAHERIILEYFDIKRADFKDLQNKTEFNRVYMDAVNGNEESLKKIGTYKVRVTDETRKKMLNSMALRNARKNVSEETSIELILNSVKEMCESGKDYSKQRNSLNDALNAGKISDMDIAITCFNSADKELAYEYFTLTTSDIETMLGAETITNPKRLLLRCANSSTDLAIDTMKNVMRMPKLSQDIKDKMKLFISVAETM